MKRHVPTVLVERPVPATQRVRVYTTNAEGEELEEAFFTLALGDSIEIEQLDAVDLSDMN